MFFFIFSYLLHHFQTPFHLDDEVLSDSYPIKEVDDVVYEVEAKVVYPTITTTPVVDSVALKKMVKLIVISYLPTCLQTITKTEGAYDIGANPSQEGGGEDEGFDTTAETVINVVDSHRLQQTAYDKVIRNVLLKHPNR